MLASKIAPIVRVMTMAAGLAALTAGAASACDCGGYYHRYHHDGYGYGNYSCYGGGYDCRYEGDRGYYYHDDYRGDYRYGGYDGHRYDERYRHDDRDYRGYRR